MAKKDLGDLGWDRSLDYEFDDPFAPVSKQKKRGVVSRVATNFADGAKAAFTTPSTLKTMASDMLPKGYGTAFQAGSDIYRQGEELHNIAMKELEPSLPAMRRITQRNLPKVQRFLPRGVAAKLDEFAKHRPWKSTTPEQQQEEELKRSMGAVFGVQMEENARQNTEDRMERALQHAQSTKQSRNQLQSLNMIQQGMMRLVSYQDEVTNRYQRRSLELQTRQYFLTRDAFRLQTETARRLNAHLESLVTNTAMPDIAKQDLSHTATQTFRNKLLGGLQDSAGKYATTYLQRVGKKAGDALKGAMGGLAGGIDMMDSDSDTPFIEVAARIVGEYGMQGAAKLAGGPLRKLLSKRFPGLDQNGAQIERLVKDWPLLMNKYARSASKRGGLKGAAEDMFKSFLPTYEMNTTVGKDGVGSLDKPAAFDRLTRRSIVEIIPGYLSRMEHHLARIHDPKAQRQVFSHDKRQFTTVRKAGKAASASILNHSDRAVTKRDTDELIDKMVGGKPISAETRRALFRQILMDSGKGESFNPQRYISGEADLSHMPAKAREELRGIMSAGQMGDQTWLRDTSDLYRNIDFARRVPAAGASVYRSTGQRDILMDQGLLTREGDTDKINVDKILQLIERADMGDIKLKETTAAERFMTQGMAAVKGRLKESVDDLRDENGNIVLSNAKLKAGAYRDAITGNIIKRWEDIRGKVEDISQKDVFIDVNKLSGGLMDGNGKPIVFNLRTVMNKAAAFSVETTQRVSQRVGAKVVEIRDIVNSRGEVLLSGWKLRAGKYRDALTGKTILRAEDIAGPVIDENGETVVTAADALDLSMKNGARLDSVAAKMRSNAQSTASSAGMAFDDVTGKVGTPADAQQAGGLFNEPGMMGDTSDLVRLNAEQVELLKVIAQILATQGGGGQYPKGFLDSIALFGLKGAFKGAKGIAQGSLWWAKKSVSLFTKPFTAAAGAAGALISGGSHRIGNIVRGIKDIYVTGKSKPVMIVQKIRMGHYQDVNSKKTVTRWMDVTGPVTDKITGETVVDQEDFEKGLYVKGPAGLVRLATKSVMNFGSAVVSFYGNAAALPFKAASLALKGIGATFKWATNKQVDVYVKGESSPRLQATKMKTGRYYNVSPKKMGVTVRTYEDIFGEIKELQPGQHVAQKDDKTVLYEDEIHNPGLVGRWGTSLRTPLSRLIGAIGGAAVSVVKGAGALFGGALKGYGKFFGGLMGFGGGMLGAPFKMLGALLNPFEKHGAKQVEWLEKIFTVLDARLPGKKARKGSWQDQYEQRDAEAKENEKEEADVEREKKWGVGSLLKFLGGKAKGLFGLGGEEDEEDEEGGGGNTVIMGGGAAGEKAKADKRARRMALKKRAGRRAGKLGFLFRGKDAIAAQAAKLRGKKKPGLAGAAKAGRFSRFGRFLGSPGKMAATLAASMGGGYLLDKALGANSSSRQAVSTATDVGTTALMASSVSGMVGGPTITGALGLGGATAAGATAAAGTTAAAGAGVSAGAAAATGAAAVGGGAAAVIGAPVWVPVAIGAAVVAGAGIAAYYGYKKYKFGKLTPVRRFRYLQYGVAPGESGNNEKIFELEQMLLDHVGERNGAIDLMVKSQGGGKDVTIEDVFKVMDLDDGWFSNKLESRRIFVAWYTSRFKPIFLQWVKAVREADPAMSLLDADEKLSGEKLKTALSKAWGISRQLYGITASPFEGTPAVTDFTAIESAYHLAVKEADKTAGERKWDGIKDKVKALGAITPGYGWIATAIDNKREESAAKKEGDALTAKAMEKASGTGMLATVGGIALTGAVGDYVAPPLSRMNKVTALMAIRYRAYGLTEMETDKARALSALESLVFRNVSVSSTGTPHLSISAEQAWLAASGLFGLLPNQAKDRLRWMAWFGKRFLPVCLAYVQAVRSINPTADLDVPERSLKPPQMLDVAQRMLNAKNSEGGSIWDWTMSPWNAGERLGSDSNSIQGSLLVLKQAADKKVMAEAVADGQKAALNKNKGVMQAMMDDMKNRSQKASDWLMGDANNRNWLGRAVDGAKGVASTVGNGYANAYSQAKQGNYGTAASMAMSASAAPGQAALGALGFGPSLAHPGNGTGGDINSLPNVPSNAEIGAMRPAQRFASLKPLLDAVAKMTGVDPNMLYAIASIESTFNTGAKAPTSSASGLFQFIRGTWSNMLRKYGGKYGVASGASPFDAKANALMGAMFLKENYGALKQKLSRGINETDMYMAHFMGAGGARDFLTRDPNTIGAQAFPQQAAANKWIFYRTVNRGGKSVPDSSQPLTLGQIYQLMQAKVAKAQAVYGGGTAARANFSDVSAEVTGRKADFSGVTSSVLGAGGPTAPANGTAAAAAVAAASAPTPGSTGASSLASGGGYAGMMSGASVPTLGAAMPAAPSITNTGSLGAAAAAAGAGEEAARQAAERDRLARANQQREATTQSQFQTQTDRSRSDAVNEVLQRQLETQGRIEKNTLDTVGLLQQILRSGSLASGSGQETVDPVAAKPNESPSTRPYQARQNVPVSTRFANANGG